MRVFTIGTDHRKPYDFTRILLKYGVEVVFDVRRIPESQEDYFRRDGLQALTSAQGIDYVYLGNELGAPRNMSNSEWISSDEFRRGIDIIRIKAGRRACCILCAERFPEHCHRLIIMDELRKSGIEAVHILDETTTWLPPPALASVPRSGPPQRRPSGPGPRPGRGRGRFRPR